MNEPDEPTEPKALEMEVTTDDLVPSLWKRLLDELIEQGITFGKQYSLAYLEQRLLCKADTMQFGIYISHINDDLKTDGLYLSSRGQDGAGYIVLNEEDAEALACARVSRSFNEMKRAMVLFGGLARNPDANISEQTKDRLLKNEEKAATRLALMRRPIGSKRKLDALEGPKE